MIFKPLGNKVIIEKQNDIRQSAGGILLVCRPTSVPCIGIVRAVGTGITESDGNIVPVCVKVGDRVAFGDKEKQLYDTDNDKMMVIPAEHIYGRLDDDGQFEPLNNVIMVEKEQDPDFSAGGIKLAKRPEFIATTGMVLAAGPGIHDEYGEWHPVSVKPGDRIAYSVTFQKTWDIDNTDIVMVLPGGIYGVLPPVEEAELATA
jgi:chaperonin GroES